MARSKETRLVYEQHSFDVDGSARLPRRLYTAQDVERLHEALEPFVSLSELRRLVADGKEIREALKTDAPPPALRALMWAVEEVFRPVARESIRSPRDAVGYFMALLGEKDQEELYTMTLNTKNRVLGVNMVYRGSVNSAQVRVCEVYKEAVRQNAAAIIFVHNHPSSTVEPSPEDILVTRQIVEAGKLLDIDCLDALIVGKGNWVSLRERGLGFPT